MEIRLIVDNPPELLFGYGSLVNTLSVVSGCFCCEFNRSLHPFSTHLNFGQLWLVVVWN